MAVGNRVFYDANKEAHEFANTLKGPVGDQLSAVQAKIQELQKMANEGGAFSFYDEAMAVKSGRSGSADVRKELAVLREEERRLSEMSDRERADAEYKIAKEKYDKDMDLWRAAQDKKDAIAKARFDEITQLQVEAAGSEFERIRMEADVAMSAARDKYGADGGAGYDQLIRLIIEKRDRLLGEANDKSVRKMEDDRIASEKRIADAALKFQMDGVRRLEDYRRSIAQGFGVGDVASSDISALVDAMKQVTSNQISSRD
jgi:hypothetical protein